MIDFISFRSLPALEAFSLSNVLSWELLQEVMQIGYRVGLICRFRVLIGFSGLTGC